MKTTIEEEILIEFDSNLKDLSAELSKAQAEVKAFTSSASTSFADIGRIVGVATIAIGAFSAAVASVVVPIINTAAEFEKFKTVLETLEGSSEAAEKSLDWITEFASTTPYELTEVTDAFVKLRAYGFDPMDGSLRVLGDTAAAMGKDIMQVVEAMADAVVGETERLKEFGIKASKTGEEISFRYAKASGEMTSVTVANNEKIIKSTLEAIWSEKYGGAMNKLSSTWDGMLSNLMDNVTKFEADVAATGLFDSFKDALGEVSKIFEEFSANEANVIGVAKTITTAIAIIARAAQGVSYIITGWRMIAANVEVVFKNAGIAVAAIITQLEKEWYETILNIKKGIAEISGYIGIDTDLGIAETEAVVASLDASLAKLTKEAKENLSVLGETVHMQDEQNQMIQKALEPFTDIELHTAKTRDIQKEVTEEVRNTAKAAEEITYSTKQYQSALGLVLTDAEKINQKYLEALPVAEAMFDETDMRRFYSSWASELEGLGKATVSISDEIQDAVGGQLENAFMKSIRNMMDGVNDLGEVFETLFKDLAAEIIRIAFVKRAEESISSGIIGLFSVPQAAGFSSLGSDSGASAGAVGSAVGTAVTVPNYTPSYTPSTNYAQAAEPARVTVNNYSSNEVDVRQSGNEIEIIIQRLATDITRGSGPVPSAFETRYGLSKR